MNYNRYDVAVMNYPLFSEKENIDIEDKIFGSQETESGPVPLYIHIPFCSSLCDFCIYNRILAPKDRTFIEQYVEALVQEIRMYGAHKKLARQRIESVFIGGGTPTVLTEPQLYRIVSAVRDCFETEGCEWTIECNPANAGPSKLSLLKDLGITRISTGVQTFDRVLRKKMHMQGDDAELVEWLALANRIGFSDVSIDLIYGFPQTHVSHFLADIAKALTLNLGHISVYKLTVFSYTKLYKAIEQGQAGSLPSDKTLYTMFLEAHRCLLRNGYLLQSTQEYGRPDQGVKFWDLTYDGYGNNLSFGVSSYGYLNGYCYQNEPSVAHYIEKIGRQRLPISRISPKITAEQRMERAAIMGFRKGYVSKKAFYSVFGKPLFQVFPDLLERHLQQGYIKEEDNGYFLTEKGLYCQGTVSADYMVSIFRGVSPLKKKMCVGTHEMP